VVANWKMHLGDQAGVRAAAQVAAAYGKLATQPPLVICPPFTVLREVHAAVSAAGIPIGSQDVSASPEGAHTGDVSAAMVAAAGCRYAIVGHSERREHLGETDTMVNAKIRRSLEAGLTPILCVGETWDERSEGQPELVIMRQLQSALAGISLGSERQLLVAYEPRWAIGTGQPVEPNEARHMGHLINHLAVDGEHFGFSCVHPQRQVKVLYGGSVTAQNIGDYCAAGVLDGALVGGASLAPASLLGLLRAVS
jgi:triosephosphate isomerase